MDLGGSAAAPGSIEREDQREGTLQLEWLDSRAGGEPVRRRELDLAVVRPGRQKAQNLVEVHERVEDVEAAGGDHAEDGGGGLSE